MRAVTLAACALLAVSVPAAAQEPNARTDADLRCAVWAAILASERENAAEAQAFTLTMTYFLGRLEQRTGKSMDEALTSDLSFQIATDMEAATALCQPLMLAMGERLVRFGEKLEALGSAEEPGDGTS